MTEYYDTYLSKFESVPEHKFSLRHRIKMKKIFRIYEKNVKKLYHEPAAKPHEISKVRLNRKTVLAIVAIVLLSVIAGCAVAYFVSESFRGTVHDDNTQLFAINLEGAPTTLEYTYTLSEPPQGFDIIESDISDFAAYTKYYNRDVEKTIIITQYVKKYYSINYNTEKGELKSVLINGCNGAFFKVISGIDVTYVLLWDDGDYVLEISSDFDKISLYELAKMLK